MAVNLTPALALASYRAGANVLPGIVVAGTCYDMHAACALADLPRDARSALEAGVGSALMAWANVAASLETLGTAVAAAAAAGRVAAVKDVRYAAPFSPVRIFAAAANYHEHAKEMGTKLAERGQGEPYFFPKADSAVIGPGETVVKPSRVERLDWEVELAVVIGKGGRNISQADAMSHVAGYTIMNDVSARDQNVRTDFPFKHDWFRGKSWDTFAPLGPVLVPASRIPDPMHLRLGMTVSGASMQDASTDGMVYNIVEQIEYLSRLLTLRPGDVIATGTPDGVGMGRGVFLKSGDVMRAWIEGIGALENPVRAE
jgi:2,4-diketo-3-deoxy-L-fuconate hydrolase